MDVCFKIEAQIVKHNGKPKGKFWERVYCCDMKGADCFHYTTLHY